MTPEGGLVQQLQLTSDAYEIILVPGDRLDSAYTKITEVIRAIGIAYPDAQIAADYTGGTKSMSSALVLAALDSPGIEVFVVTGTRKDLVKVEQGTQRTRRVRIDAVYIRREFQLALKHWEHYDYAPAASRLNQLIQGQEVSEADEQIYRAEQISLAYAAWDCCRYQQAYHQLTPFVGVVPALQIYVEQVHFLLDDQDALRRDYLRIWDLWFNALRRARQGRFDDGVARCYRLVEAAAQWLLKHVYDIDTSKVRYDQLPEGFRPAATQDTVQLGLFEAWRLISRLDRGPLAQWIGQEREHLEHYISIRNYSCLAHGLRPITEEEWAQWQTWLETSFFPALQAQGRDHGLRKTPQQLPRTWFS